VVLWARSYWRSDDIFLIYGGNGSAHLRICRGMLSFNHTSARSSTKRIAIQQVSITTGRIGGRPEDFALPKSFSTHKEWLSFRFDSISSVQIASMQSAHAADVLSAKRAAFAALRDSDRATYQFENALYAGPGGNRALQEHLSLTYRQMLAAKEQAAAMRAAASQIGAASVPLLTPQWQVTFPSWSLLMIASIPIAILLWQAQSRRRQIGRGLCGHCGYDLHANTSGICPECGTLVSIVLCRSITVDGKRVLSITPTVPATAVDLR
jgi:hypothetical protein